MSDEIPIYKRVNRQWKTLPKKGDDVAIKDPKLKQGYLGDLKKKTVLELEEIWKRNEQVLNNKVLLSKLKDKGENLRARQAEIVKALEEARVKERISKGVLDQDDIYGFEWTGSLTINTMCQRQPNEKQVLEEDEENLDPLELMAHHSFSVDHRERRLSRSVEEDPAAAIVRELEQMEINDSRVGAELQETLQFGAKRIEMIQRKYEQNGPVKTHFKPFRPVSNPKPIPGLDIRSQKPLEMKSVICISQEESQRLEKEYLDRQKERELKLTIEGLTRPNKVSNICQLPSSTLSNYRDASVMKHILDSDEEEEEEDDGFLLGELEGTEDDNFY